MKKREYLGYIRDKYLKLSADYLAELLHGKNTPLLKALNAVLTSLNIEQQNQGKDTDSAATRRKKIKQ